MPTRYTDEQLAAAAAAGTPEREASFEGQPDDTWPRYQEKWFRTFTGEELPPPDDQNRGKRWKAARRQHGKIETQRQNDPASSAQHAAAQLAQRQC